MERRSRDQTKNMYETHGQRPSVGIDSRSGVWHRRRKANGEKIGTTVIE